jgi:hypothetical protein
VGSERLRCEGEGGGVSFLEGSQASPARPSDKSNQQNDNSKHSNGFKENSVQICLLRACLFYSSTLKMEARRSSKTSVNVYLTAKHHIAEDFSFRTIQISPLRAIILRNLAKCALSTPIFRVTIMQDMIHFMFYFIIQVVYMRKHYDCEKIDFAMLTDSYVLRLDINTKNIVRMYSNILYLIWTGTNVYRKQPASGCWYPGTTFKPGTPK